MRFYSISKAAEILGVSRTTIYTWKRLGKIKILDMNGLPRVSEDEIRRITGTQEEK